MPAYQQFDPESLRRQQAQREAQMRAQRIDGTLDDLIESDVKETSRISEWRKKTPGAQDMFDHFRRNNIQEVTNETLKDYLDRVPEDQRNSVNLYRRLLENYEKLSFEDNSASDGGLRVREKAQKEITAVVSLLSDWSSVMTESREKRDNILHKEGPSFVSEPIEWTASNVWKPIDSFAGGFVRSSGKDKLIMLAGVAVSFIVLKKIMKLGKNGDKRWKNLKKVIGIGLGIPVAYMGLSAVNKMVEKSSGRPLLSMDGGMLTGHSAEEWQASKHKSEIEDIHATLGSESVNIPNEFMSQIQGGESKYGVGLGNLTSLTVAELQSLYESSQNSRSVSFDNSLYKKTINNEQGQPLNDMLSEHERYFMVKDVANTLGLLNSNGDFVLPDPAMAQDSVLYLAMTWDNDEEEE